MSMAGRSLSWTAPSLGRHRPAILVVTVLALGYTIYYVRQQILSTPHRAKGSLHRSGAHRRTRRRRSISRAQDRRRHEAHPEYANNSPWGTVPVSTDFLADSDANERKYGDHIFVLSEDVVTRIPLMRHMPSASRLLDTVAANQQEAAAFREELEQGFLKLYFLLHIPPSPISPEQTDSIMAELTRNGEFNSVNISEALQQHQSRLLENSIEEWDAVQDTRRQSRSTRRSSLPSDPTLEALQRRGALTEAPSITDMDSEPLVEGHGKADQDIEAGNESQSLLNLLYRMMEDQARQEGYVHRRVTCDGCNVTPIKGIRYRCSNCPDYDLCELCEASQMHPKTHLFYKIRIPAPFLSHPRQPEPVQYPGKPAAEVQILTRDSIKKLSDMTGFQTSEIEAFWEQFRSLAATEWPDDPDHHNLAIDRQTFDKCFIPTTSIRPPPPNLIYDRMFSYYDQNNDGFIGFEEFVAGLASFTHRNADERQLRIFKAFDINDDGFVNRDDFLKMFKGYYTATKELAQEIVVKTEDDFSENRGREIVFGSNPISSSFTDPLPYGESSRLGQGKVYDAYGDSRIHDDMGAVDVMDHDVADLDELSADAAEENKYGHLRPGNTNAFADFTSLYNTPWPPRGISRGDIEKALNAPHQLEKIVKPEDQYAVRRAVHARLARDHQGRQEVRRLVIRERRQERRQAPLTRLPWIDRPTSNDALMYGDFDIVRTSTQFPMFRTSLIKDVEQLDWPIESPTMMVDEVLTLLEDCWTADAIVQDFSGYGSGPSDSRRLVQILSRRIAKATKKLALEAGTPIGSCPYLRRSRSSSKARLEDTPGPDNEHEARSVTSTPSCGTPVDQNWGPWDTFEELEPEPDAGREVLYQVTEVAMNELLDPIFSLREGLAHKVQETQQVRKQHRAKIFATIRRPFELKCLLDSFQRRWRRDQDFAVVCHRPGKPITDAFLVFLHEEAIGVERDLTTERCPYCAEAGEERRVKLGGYCTCLFPSTGRRAGLAPMELCPSCAQQGIEGNVGGIHGEGICGRCGTPSQQYQEEVDRLRDILWGPTPLLPLHPYNRERKLDLDARFTTVSPAGPSRSTSPPGDPTLPQNRSNTASPVDHTPFQNRLNSFSDFTTEQAESLDGLANNRDLPTAAPPPSLGADRLPPSRIVEQSAERNAQLQARERSMGKETIAQIRACAEEGALEEASEDENGPPRPANDTLRWYACLDFIEAEDEERGGVGRLNFEEFEEVMNGNKGQGLKFLGSWIEMASF